MFPNDYDLIRARRDKLVHLRATAPLSDERRQVEEASADDVSALLDILDYYGDELDKQQNRGATLHELNATLRESLRDQRDTNAVLRGTS